MIINRDKPVKDDIFNTPESLKEIEQKFSTTIKNKEKYKLKWRIKDENTNR